MAAKFLAGDHSVDMLIERNPFSEGDPPRYAILLDKGFISRLCGIGLLGLCFIIMNIQELEVPKRRLVTGGKEKSRRYISLLFN